MREGIYTAGYLGVGPSVREYIVAQHGTLAIACKKRPTTKLMMVTSKFKSLCTNSSFH